MSDGTGDANTLEGMLANSSDYEGLRVFTTDTTYQDFDNEYIRMDMDESGELTFTRLETRDGENLGPNSAVLPYKYYVAAPSRDFRILYIMCATLKLESVKVVGTQFHYVSEPSQIAVFNKWVSTSCY